MHQPLHPHAARGTMPAGHPPHPHAKGHPGAGHPGARHPGAMPVAGTTGHPGMAKPAGGPPAGGPPRMPPHVVDGLWRGACAEAATSPLPRVLYLHFPFCKKRCAFCPFFINRFNKGLLNDYVEALLEEIRLTGQAEGLRAAPIEAIYFGGGTPSDLPPEAVHRLLDALRAAFPLAPDCEITMEGRVHGTSGVLAREWIAAGVNRISLGVQTFDTALRKRLGRIESRETILAVLGELTALDGVTVNIDLLYGLPGQTRAQFLADIVTVESSTGLHGFDLYHLKSFPGSPLAEAVMQGELPAPARLREKEGYYESAARWLRPTGFRQISTCHWARDPRERSLYNRLAKGRSEIIPLGSGAGGRVGSINLFQTRQLPAYLEAVAEGRKPIAFAAPRRPLENLKDGLCADLEAGRLTAPVRHELLAARPDAERFLRRWLKMEFFALPSTGAEDFALTTSGRFWSPVLLDHLCRQLGTPSHGI